MKAVAIRGEGDRAFCAGGDIRAVQEAAKAGRDDGAHLLRDEYFMNALIGAYPKPYVALIHGICMGGGAGVSVHGRYRLADPSLMFAMPGDRHRVHSRYRQQPFPVLARLIAWACIWASPPAASALAMRWRRG